MGKTGVLDIVNQAIAQSIKQQELERKKNKLSKAEDLQTQAFQRDYQNQMDLINEKIGNKVKATEKWVFQISNKLKIKRYGNL